MGTSKSLNYRMLGLESSLLAMNVSEGERIGADDKA
jgi:hypothetical protein